jgi:hypothetical protein
VRQAFIFVYAFYFSDVIDRHRSPLDFRIGRRVIEERRGKLLILRQLKAFISY